jgi:nucleotide-binding universal stress UspA family protein
MPARLQAQPVQILFASDGSDHARAAACLLNELPLPPESQVTILSVLIPRHGDTFFGLHDVMIRETQALIKGNGVRVQVELQTGYPAEKVLEYTQMHPVDLVVLGAKGLRHTLGILLGGVAQQVVEYSPTPVLVVRAPYRGVKRILLVTDGSPNSSRMLNFLCGAGERPCLPLPPEAEIEVVHVTPPAGAHFKYLQAAYPSAQVDFPADELAARQAEDEKLGQEVLHQAVETLHQAGLKAAPVLLNGDAATEIIQYAKDRQIDLIMAGSRGLNPAKGWLLGSVSRKLVHYSDSSVLIVK